MKLINISSSNTANINKAIIPIAGLGTRLLPFSKVIPKAMLPVYNKPCVQWIVEELVDAGIEEIIFIYSRGQELVQEYFAGKNWYDETLIARGNLEEAQFLADIRNLAKFHFIEQTEQLGDGHAILQAADLIDDDEAVIVVFGDCLYYQDQPNKKMIDHYRQHGRSIVALQAVAADAVSQFGIVGLVDDQDPCNFDIAEMVEKPEPESAPSDLAIIGRYLLAPEIWPHIKQQRAGSGEIRLIDALQSLLKEAPIHGLKMTGQWLDTGTIESLWQAGEILREDLARK